LNFAAQQPADQSAGQYTFVPCGDLARHIENAEPSKLNLVAMSLAQELLRNGWQRDPHAGSSARRFIRAGTALDVDRALGDLAHGRLSGESWRAACHQTGITFIKVAIPSQGTIAPMTAAGNGLDPVFGGGSFGSGSNGRKAALSSAAVVIAVVVRVALVFTGGTEFPSNTTAAGCGCDDTTPPPAQLQTSGPNSSADGRSNLPGGFASLKYEAVAGQGETRSDANGSGGPHDGAVWATSSQTGTGISEIRLMHLIFEPTLNSPARVRGLVAVRNASANRMARRPVRVKHISVRGRKGYAWQFKTASDNWMFVAVFPDLVHSIELRCWGAQDDNTAIKARCREALNSLKFKQTA
jgi:hypothetical protein